MIRRNAASESLRWVGTLTASTLVRSLAKVFSGDLLSKAIGMLTAVLLIRGLSIEEYAHYVAFTTVLYLLPSLLGGGMNLATVRFSAEHISRTDERPVPLYILSFVAQLAIYAVCGGLVLGFASGASRILFGREEFATSLKLGLLAGTGVLVTQAGRAMFQAEERFGLYVITLWVRQLIVLVLVGAALLLGRLTYGVTVWMITFAELLVAVTIVVSIFRELARLKIPDLRSYRALFAEFLSSSIWLIAYTIVLAIFDRLDVLMLSHLSASSELANYGVAGRFYSSALLLLSSIHAVLAPRFANVEMLDREKQRRFTTKWLRLTLWLPLPVLGGLVLGQPLFLWVVGEQYERSFWILLVLSVGLCLSLAFSPIVNVLMARKEFKFVFGLGVLALALNVIGNLSLIPRWGGVGAAAITVVTHATVNGLSALKVLRSSPK